MVSVTIIYWRDIPAQVIVGKGRKSAKRQLSDRFEKAIDMAAMRAKIEGTDEYLAEWRKVQTCTLEGKESLLAEMEAARLEAAYDAECIKKLVENLGWAET